MSVCIYFTSLFFIYFCTEFTVHDFMTNLFTYSFIYHLPINFKKLHYFSFIHVCVSTQTRRDSTYYSIDIRGFLHKIQKKNKIEILIHVTFYKLMNACFLLNIISAHLFINFFI